jgi:hypothetical protein
MSDDSWCTGGTGEISEVRARYCDVIESLQLSTQPNAHLSWRAADRVHTYLVIS